MVSKDFILKSIETAIVNKCETSSKARKRGIGGEYITVHDEDGLPHHEIHYPDGTVVDYTDSKGLVSVTIDGETYDFPGKKSKNYEYSMFDYMSDMLKDMDGILNYSNMYSFLRAYTDDFATWLGMRINSNLREGVDLKDIDDIHIWNDVIVDGHDTVVELERSLKIDNENYACVRLQSNLNHGGDAIEKKFVSDKAHTATTVGGDWESQLINFTRTGDAEDSWKIITLISKDSGATGLFFGNALKEERSNDWEAEVQFAPRQKFERMLIDEDNKIIIQKPVVK